MAVCYLGIGSNLGNRTQNLKLVLRRIDNLKNTKLLKVSKIIETLPLGGPAHQGKFLNAALKIKTSLSPIALLKNLKEIEKELGRAKSVRWSPRPIDIDILLYNDTIIKSKELTIPHPRMMQRDFVLKPLAGIL